MKIQSNERGGNDAYYELFKAIYDRNVIKLVAPEKAMTLKTQFESTFRFKDASYKVIYGQMVRFGILDSERWYNTEKKEVVSHATPENTYPNSHETDYIFIPAAHRFYFGVSTKVTIPATFAFLSKALNEVISNAESIRINLIQSSDTIEEIIESAGIKLLNVDISLYK